MLKNQLNVRILRWHQFPAAVSARCGRREGADDHREHPPSMRPWTQANQETVIANMREELDSGVDPRQRNHPSIVLWRPRTRITSAWGASSRKASVPFRYHSRRHPTRPVIHDGDEDLNGLAGTFNWHYPEGYEQLPKGSIYGWASKSIRQATGVGEFRPALGSRRSSRRSSGGTVPVAGPSRCEFYRHPPLCDDLGLG